MNKRNLLLTIGATLALTSVAAPITPEEAIQRLRSEAPARIKARAPMSATPTYTSVTPSGMIKSPVSLLQPWKAWLPIEVTLLGKTKLPVNPLQP